MIYFPIILIIVLDLTSCSDKPNQGDSNLSKNNQPEDVQKSETPLENLFPDDLSVQACETGDFSYLYNCSDAEEIYLIRLDQHFKNPLYITVHLKDTIVDSFCYFSFKLVYTSNKEPENVKGYPNVLTVERNFGEIIYFHYYYKQARCTHIDNKDALSISNFFRHDFWNLPKDGPWGGVDMDPEVWSIQGRKPGLSERVISRSSFKDSLFYSHIQRVLDICKITDYKYIKPVK